MSENVVTTSDLAPVKVPKSFKDLNREQLVAAAVAFGTLEEGNMEELRADLTESGVTFKQYLEAFYPKETAKVEPEKFELPPLTNVEDWPDADEGVNQVNEIVTVEPVVELVPATKYLIKFTGENPYFERGRYKFTSEKPYAIMSAEDAQEALVQEPTKFRQAFPAELQEYYG